MPKKLRSRIRQSSQGSSNASVSASPSEVGNAGDEVAPPFEKKHVHYQKSYNKPPTPPPQRLPPQRLPPQRLPRWILRRSIKSLKSSQFTLAKMLTAIGVVILAYFLFTIWQAAALRNMIRQPFDAPFVIARNESSPLRNADRFWGSYRPGVYFGLKTRSPQSPVVGMMWSSAFAPGTLRHWCEQSDRLEHYGWVAHDGVNFGVHEVVDTTFTVTSSFVKQPGGSHGGDWSARISVKPKRQHSDAVVSLFFYMALDGVGSIQAHNEGSQLHRITGQTPQLGSFQMKFTPSDVLSGGRQRMHFLATAATGLDRLREAVEEQMRSYTWLPKNRQLVYRGLPGSVVATGQANLLVFQVTGTLPLGLEMAFESDSASRILPLVGATYNSELERHLEAFRLRFAKVFPLAEHGYGNQVGFAAATFSNLLGGVGYFYGSSLVQVGEPDEPAEEAWPTALYTAVPSRSFFPRGFLWDEGFHALLLSRWNPHIVMDIVGHWLDLINTQGWLGREQILGAEARAKVPAAFVVQHPDVANPPTLFLPLVQLVPKLAASDDPINTAYLERLYPRLRAWFQWLNRTQAGAQPGEYRWRGRHADAVVELNPKTLASGLDDYPRASHPTDDERHVDLRCWLAVAAGVMADIAKAVGDDEQSFRDLHQQLTDNTLLDSLHWSPKAQRYSDYGLHTDDITLIRPAPPPPKPNQPPPPQRQLERVVRRPPVFRFVDTTFGYISLFPFILKIIEPTSPKLARVLSDLQDPSLVWTNFGIRSMARDAPLFEKRNTEHDPPYWRGAIWMNVNYLALDALQHYATVSGPEQQRAENIYSQLRHNIVQNVLRQYKATGYVWEQYDGNTGQGKGCHPFTGWSALVVSIMAETY